LSNILTHVDLGPKVPNYPPPADRAPDAVRVHQTSMETAHLHADPEPGKKMGFGGPIIHGLFSWNMSAHAILQAFGSSKPENMKEFQARFAAPVKPADKLITEMWRTGEKDGDGFEEIRFIVRVEGGKTVLTNGRALVKVEGQIKAKL
jgi:acyl dehydratase